MTSTRPNPEYEAFVAAKAAYKSALEGCLAARADGLDASRPLTCSISEAAECDGVAACSDVTLEQIDLPALWRVDFAAKQLSSQDGQRTSPIAALETLDGALILQGHQNGRGWTLVVERAAGHLSASAADAEGAFVLAGSCTAA
ncbi:MAG TPA: hypothetical protein VII72_06070 [Myxococcota bacterium]